MGLLKVLIIFGVLIGLAAVFIQRAFSEADAYSMTDHKYPLELEPDDLESYMFLRKAYHRQHHLFESLGIPWHSSRLTSVLTFMNKLMNQLFLYQNGSLIEENSTEFNGILVSIYRPLATKGPLPAIVFFHGGGFVIGSRELHALALMEIARDTQTIIINVEYRLAPDHIFPAAFDDCLSATIYTFENAKELGILPEKISVMGDSAGGNLAAAVSIAVWKIKKYKLQRQIVIYPVTQVASFSTSSYIKYADVGILSRERGLGFISCYLNHTTECMGKNQHLSNVNRVKGFFPDFAQEKNGKNCRKIDDVVFDSRVSVGFATDEELAASPRTFLVIAEADILRDDGFLYYNRLKKVNVDVTLKHYKTAFHAFYFQGCQLCPTKLEIGRVALEDLKKFIKK